MRSIISSQARTCLRSTARGNYKVPLSAIRWSSSGSRKWSTPLAEQLTKAIEVPCSGSKLLKRTFINHSAGHWPNLNGEIHANVLDIRYGSVLYF